MGKLSPGTNASCSGTRCRSFTVDERARVPFALIGVLLLVTSSTYAAGIADQGLIGEDRSVERAVERVDADSTAALRAAARQAAHDAAAEPVTRAPDGSAAGSEDGHGSTAVRNGSAFEDAFRIRLAIAGSEALAAVDAEVGDVTATASLPAVDGPSELAAARDRIRVEPAANGTATRVTFEGVETTATRSGRTVVERTEDRTVVVAVPTLAAHERTERFEERLNRGPVEGPGLGRQITASLYAMTWARGYGQYAGAPVENVLANRHVELSTNAGIVRTQRDVFGTSDPNARGGVARATARTGVTDLLKPTGVDEGSWTEAVLSAPTPGVRDGPGERDGSGENDTPGDQPSEDAAFEFGEERTDERTSVPVGRAADEGATRVYDDLDAIIESAYRVEARVETSTTQVVDGGRPTPPTPSPSEFTTTGDWERVDLTRTERSPIISGSGVPEGVPSGIVDPGERVSFGLETREATVKRVAVAEWERVTVERGPNGSVVDERVHRATTRDAVTDHYRVRVSVSGEHAPTDGAPDRATATFGAGDASDGPDLRDTPPIARVDLDVDTENGVDRITEDAISGGEVTRSTTVVGSRSEADRNAVAADVAALASDVRDIETEASMEDAAVGEAEPYADLADAIRDRRAELVDAPVTYDGAADRAGTAARTAYLDAVIDELESAASDRERATDGFLDRVNSAFDGPDVGDALASREAARDSGTYAIGEDGPGGAVTFEPNGSPGYLPRTTVDGEAVDGVDGTTTRPLAVRNVNYVTVPYGEVSSGVVDRILGTEDTVRVGTAGRSLLLANDALAADDDPDLRADRDALARQIDGSLDEVDGALGSTLRVRTSLSRDERRRALDEAAASYGSPGERAVAVGDGSYPDRVAAEAASVGSLSRAAEEALAANLRVATRTAAGRDAVRVPTRFVDETTSGARVLLRDRMEKAVENQAARAGKAATGKVSEKAVKELGEKWSMKPARTVGAGLPVAPVPGYWVTTVNAWRVQIRGEYPRFALRANVGTPDKRFTYVRSEGDVTVDVGGETVQLGKTEPIAFEAETVVAVAVPAGPPGVGDVDGTRDERSGGWPCPGAMGESPSGGEGKCSKP
ncbi:conserved hypothetical protein [Halorubrum lacusprofundi ATCC 49239]|uniref:Uncharacterized protein n=1 Tax=Halorubrum lacusprofundi (strain ATCC 49239 / DSM 5036 / JCM 8891 / ACAM 34) TaxID=416348 RepID=B9LRH2_HALLT|nr:conserved hypothetical protein [Halorubrum lacusprofundi ATCC 49239]